MKPYLQVSLAMLALFLIVLVILALFPFTEPSSNGVSRLVDTQYNVLCYYSRFAMSCVSLHP